MRWQEGIRLMGIISVVGIYEHDRHIKYLKIQ